MIMSIHQAHYQVMRNMLNQMWLSGMMMWSLWSKWEVSQFKWTKLQGHRQKDKVLRIWTHLKKIFGRTLTILGKQMLMWRYMIPKQELERK